MSTDVLQHLAGNGALGQNLDAYGYGPSMPASTDTALVAGVPPGVKFLPVNAAASSGDTAKTLAHATAANDDAPVLPNPSGETASPKETQAIMQTMQQLFGPGGPTFIAAAQAFTQMAALNAISARVLKVAQLKGQMMAEQGKVSAAQASFQGAMKSAGISLAGSIVGMFGAMTMTYWGAKLESTVDKKVTDPSGTADQQSRLATVDKKISDAQAKIKDLSTDRMRADEPEGKPGAEVDKQMRKHHEKLEEYEAKRSDILAEIASTDKKKKKRGPLSRAVVGSMLKTGAYSASSTITAAFTLGDTVNSTGGTYQKNMADIQKDQWGVVSLICQTNVEGAKQVVEQAQKFLEAAQQFIITHLQLVAQSENQART